MYNNYVNKVIRHENIHVAQMKDFCSYLPIGAILFYIMYFFEWIYRIFQYGFKEAYYNISFEREAYTNERNFDYNETKWRKYKDK